MLNVSKPQLLHLTEDAYNHLTGFRVVLNEKAHVRILTVGASEFIVLTPKWVLAINNVISWFLVF